MTVANATRRNWRRISTFFVAKQRLENAWQLMAANNYNVNMMSVLVDWVNMKKVGTSSTLTYPSRSVCGTLLLRKLAS